MNDTPQALTLLLAHLLGRQVMPAELQAALEWLAGNTDALSQFERLESLLAGSDDPEWLEAIAAASEGLPTPDVVEFLDRQERLGQITPEAAARFETLLASLDPNPEPFLPDFPTFAEQFEARQKKTSPQESPFPGKAIWRTIETAGQQVVRLFTEVRVLMAGTGASFDRLPDLLTPTVNPLPAGRAQPPTAVTHTLPLPSPEHNLALNLKIGPVAGDKATLSIQVKQFSSQQPVSRARVTLQSSLGQTLESDLTLEDGTVTFQYIEPGSYLVQIKLGDQVLELPITFALT